MGKRRQSREAAFQALFSIQFLETDRHEAVRRLGCIADGTVQPQDEFSSRLLNLLDERGDEVDAALERALTQWTPDRLAAPDRALVRLGVAELLFCEDVPPKVTINEYIELAKRYGDGDSPSFINAVLDRVRRDLARRREGADGLS